MIEEMNDIFKEIGLKLYNKKKQSRTRKKILIDVGKFTAKKDGMNEEITTKKSDRTEFIWKTKVYSLIRVRKSLETLYLWL